MRNSYPNRNTILAILALFIIRIPGLLFAQTHSGIPPEVYPEQSNQTSRFNHAISGYAYFMPDSIPFEGLILTFSDVGDITIDASGYYTMEVPRHWSGTATPHLCSGGGYTFDPPHLEYDDVIFDFSEQNYWGEADAILTISGKFTDKYTGEPLANAQVIFNTTNGTKANSFTVNTNEFGEYSFERLPCWSNTLDPKLGRYHYFEPFTRSYEEIQSSAGNQDYTFINFEYPIPPGWQFVNTGTFAIIAVETSSNPNICGTNLNIGDLLGVFYEDENGDLKCGGYGRWQNENNVAVMAQGDDNLTPEKDGFAYNETFKWKVYSYENQKDYPAKVELSLGLNRFVSLGTSIVNQLDAYLENSILIPEGWSGISSFTKPESISIGNVMAPIIDELVIIQDMDKMYYPDQGINTMYVWGYNKGYKIKLTAEATLPMNGCPGPSKTITLATGWNIIPVMSSCAIATGDLFDPIIEKVMIVKEIAGTKLYWPEYGIESLDILEPGKAYYVAVSQNTSLTFGDCAKNKTTLYSNTSDQINTTPWNTPTKTGSTHSIVLSGNALSNLTPGDYIGAFTSDGICAGITQLNDADQNTALSIFGDDVSTAEKDGFEDGEFLHFKSFNSQSNEETIIMANYDGGLPSFDGRFTDNGLSLIKSFSFAANGTSDFISEGAVSIYPNPTNGLVEFSNYKNETFRIAIQNINGQIILNETFEGSGQLNLSAFKKGVYIVKTEGSSFTSIDKLILK